MVDHHVINHLSKSCVYYKTKIFSLPPTCGDGGGSYDIQKNKVSPFLKTKKNTVILGCELAQDSSNIK
jgi:hypothetical protein